MKVLLRRDAIRIVTHHKKNGGDERGIRIEIHTDICIAGRWWLHCNGGCHRLPCSDEGCEGCTAHL